MSDTNIEAFREMERRLEVRPLPNIKIHVPEDAAPKLAAVIAATI